MSQYKAESSRLRLEPLNESHTQAFYEIQSSPQTMAWSYVLPYFTLASFLTLTHPSVRPLDITEIPSN